MKTIVGLTKKNIIKLSALRNEPEFILKFRLNSYHKFKKMSFPKWMNINLDLNNLNLNKLSIYSEINEENKWKTLKKIDQKMSSKFKKYNGKVAIDLVVNSRSVWITQQKKLLKQNIIFCSIYEAIKKYPELVKKYIGKLVHNDDNFFAALNSILFSDGAFCYIPKNVVCPIDLSSYFRIVDTTSNQFERTLIIAESGSKVNYLEGCSAKLSKKNQLHAAVVELFAWDNAVINYSTLQNWTNGPKGIYNLVTKRGICLGKNSKINWLQVETGSTKTVKFPSVILRGEGSQGSFKSISFSRGSMEIDTGTKMIHLGKNTVSKILSKSIVSGSSKSTFRSVVKISGSAEYSKTFSNCDSYILGNSKNNAIMLPKFQVNNNTSTVEHEAKNSFLTEEKTFFLKTRNFDCQKILNFLVYKKLETVLDDLPNEFVMEAKILIKLYLNKSLG